MKRLPRLIYGFILLLSIQADRAFAASGASSARKEWTIMVLINGNSNLERDAVDAFNLIETAVSGDRYSVVVELHRRKGKKEDGKVWSGAKRYLVTKDQDTEKIKSPVLKQLPSASPGDTGAAEDFIKWAKLNFPAKRYMLVFWDHGHGWNGKTTRTTLTDRGFAYGYESLKPLSVTDMAEILSETGPVDLLGIDACMMQMEEVGYELAAYSPIIIASESASYRYGFYYAGLIAALRANPGISPKDLAIAAVDTYAQYYSQKLVAPVTLSATSSSGTLRLAGLLDEWVTQAVLPGNAHAVFSAMRDATRFDAGYADLYDFMRIARDTSHDGEFRKKTESVMMCIDETVLAAKATKTSGPNAPRGISITIPGHDSGRENTDVTSGYERLAFSKNTRWKEFIDYLSTLKPN